MAGILITGTSSDAGKSLLVTGLCRALANRGIDVAPFKAQNMSNNSMVCADHSEIGRAQYLQALAARVEPCSAMNPVLLKPASDRRSFIVLRGQPAGTLESGEYASGRRGLAHAAWDAYEELSRAHDLVVCEGAGSPAEINLRAGDYVNMGLARQFDLPTLIVGDIDRGGVLASIVGTWALFSPEDRALLKGYIINKFRGDATILAPGLHEVSSRTGLKHYGTVPWLDGVWMDGEDTLEVGRWRQDPSADADGERLQVAVIRLPRVSNVTDVDALACEEGVDVTVTTSPSTVRQADLVVIPGSRSTLRDLEWLRERGLDEALRARHREGKPILGICGGYQMLGQTITDPIEGMGDAEGLGLLPVDVEFSKHKVLALTTSYWRDYEVHGYEIHHGLCIVMGDGEPFLDGVAVDGVYGTMMHGSLECDDFRRAFLAEVAGKAGRSWAPDPQAPGMHDLREAMIEKLAFACEKNLDIDGILRLAH